MFLLLTFVLHLTSMVITHSCRGCTVKAGNDADSFASFSAYETVSAASVSSSLDEYGSKTAVFSITDGAIISC